MGAKPSNETVTELIELYHQGLSSDVIGKKFGMKGQTVTKYLKINGIEIRGPKTKLQPGDREEMARLYQEGLSAPKIAEKFGVNNVLVLRYLEEQGVDRRSAEEAHRKYKINEDFFDNIDSEEKAYFLGFLYADGCNHKDANYISLGLEETDREILYKLSALIYIDTPEIHVKTQDRTHENKGTTTYITINSKHICGQLEKLGCVPAKTLILTYPEWMPEHLHRHFIRGYFDGDGCLYLNENNIAASYCKITSTIDFCKSVKHIIEKNTTANIGIYKAAPDALVYNANATGNRQVKNIMEWLYKDAAIYLQRKFTIYQKLRENVAEIDVLINAGTRGYNKSNLLK